MTSSQSTAPHKSLLLSHKGSDRATSSVGGALVTRHGKTHVVWQDSTDQGYLNRVATLDRETGEVSEPVTLNRGKDNHARPNLFVDDRGYLHAILSGHNSPVQYRRSKEPNDATAWTEPITIGEGTYPVAVCAPDGTIYLTMRSPNRWNGVNLFVKPPDKPWSKRAHLVRRDLQMPGYAAFHTGLTLDSNGTLHLVVDFYESAQVWERRGLHQAITYMQSQDGGRSWTTADGTPVKLPARPERMEVIAQDRAKERHEPMPPPVLRCGGSLVLDAKERPHLVYLDHRRGPGQVVHAWAADDGTWSKEPVEAIERRFPKYRPVSLRGSLTRTSDGILYALLVLYPLDSDWEEGLPTRGMTSDETRLAWLFSRDDGKTWAAAEVWEKQGMYQANVERPLGGNALPTDSAPPFVGFFGKPTSPEEGEIVQNRVCLVSAPSEPDIQASSKSAQRADTSPYQSESAWNQTVPERHRGKAGFDWPEPIAGEPNVLLIGDSISIGYTTEVRKRLEGIANVFWIPVNGRSTAETLERIDTLLAKPASGEWDVIHFNWGIHDITRVDSDGKVDREGKPQVPLSAYRRNLKRLVRRLKSTGAELIWANTTPVADGNGARRNEDIETYNEVAGQIMDRHYVVVNDLYGAVREMEGEIWKDGTHLTQEASLGLARQIQNVIAERITADFLQPVLNAVLQPAPNDTSVNSWTLPLKNVLAEKSLRVSVTAAEDNGDAWNISVEPSSLRLQPGQERSLRLRATASADAARYPLPEVVLQVSPVEEPEQTYSVRKRLPVRDEPCSVRLSSTTEAPRIDGVLDDAAWQKPPTVPLFGRMDMGRDIEVPTRAWATFDETALYVAYYVGEPNMERLKAEATQHDGNVWSDDSVELFCAPVEGNPEDYYHLIINSKGTIYDAKRKDKAFDLPGVRVESKRTKDGWQVEVSIPWRSMRLDEAPERMRMLLARLRRAGGGEEIQQFPVSPTGNHVPENFAHVELAR